jgi:hypothetical protein
LDGFVAGLGSVSGPSSKTLGLDVWAHAANGNKTDASSAMHATLSNR